MSDLSLDSVNAKIERAQDHAQLFEKELTAWMNETPYAITQKVNGDATRYSVVISITKPPPIQRWSLIFGDAIHNMRSALDHLVYAISVHESKSDPPPNAGKVAFVIKDSPNDFKSRYWQIEALSPSVQKAIESVQPYNRPHADKPPLLAVLRDFDDADKHRLIKVVVQRPTEMNFTATGPIRPNDVPVFHSPYVEFVDGAEIVWFTTKHPCPNLQLQGRVMANIAVEHAPGPGPEAERIERTGVDRLLLTDLLPEVREVVRIVSATVGP